MASAGEEIDTQDETSFANSCAVASETSTLLDPSNRETQGYKSFPDTSQHEEKWTRPRGFWLIETALWTNVFLSGFDGTITASTYALISSDFGAANDASWLTTSYLVTSTAFQPLYGRFSDLFGRRVCFFVSTATFMIGCLGCALARDILVLNVMRAFAGFGGGGLVTMATVINSDMIPFRQRGMYQAIQNVLVGMGAILGASLGGVIAQSIGWRWCFLLQVPVSLFAIAIGHRAIQDPIGDDAVYSSEWRRFYQALQRLDLSGAAFLVLALATQLVGIGCGGNNFPWASWTVIGSIFASLVLLFGFLIVEKRAGDLAVLPLGMFWGWNSIALQLTNAFSGMASYAYMFMIPLYFQAVRGDSPAAAGLRLVIPALATPVGGVLAGILMHSGTALSNNVRIGTSAMFLGNLLAVSMGARACAWKDLLYLVPANLGLGLANPSMLFSFVSIFDHREQAVATSAVYLVRSMGNIYGVTVTASIVQNILVSRLPSVLGLPADSEVIEKLRKSVFAIDDLPLQQQNSVRGVYETAIRVAFIASTGLAFFSFVFSWAVRTGSLGRNSDT